MLRNRIAVTLSILALSVAALATRDRIGLAQSQNQSVPNLSGTWELVQLAWYKKSNLGSHFPKLTLIISQSESEIKITQKSFVFGKETVHEYSYYTDGRGETNMGIIALWVYQPKFKSVSGWQEDRLLTKYSKEISTPIGKGSGSATSRRDEWRLGSQGRTLILTKTAVRNQSDFSVGGSIDPTGTRSLGSGFEKREFIFRRI